MKGTHELPSSTTRRGALGLLGGFAALALGAAPIMHAGAALDVELDVLNYRYADPTPKRIEEDATAPDVHVVDLELSNHGDQLVPLFFTWDQKRKGRHNWQIQDGPVPLPGGETARYTIAAPDETGRINAGYPAQLTVFDHGKQRWATTHFTPESRRQVISP